MSSSRYEIDAFVRALRSRFGAGELQPPPVLDDDAIREVDRDADLVAQFIQSASAAGATVERVENRDWKPIVRERLIAAGARRVRIELPHGGPALARERDELESLLAAAEIEITQGVGASELFALDAAVTLAEAAIAETGSIVCASGTESARSTSLLPQTHIVLLPRARIVADLIDYFGPLAARGDLPTNINLISGPSKTADIEGILVTGVHGPRAVHILVL